MPCRKSRIQSRTSKKRVRSCPSPYKEFGLSGMHDATGKPRGTSRRAWRGGVNKTKYGAW